MVYNCGTPIRHPFDTDGLSSISYTILIDAQQVYSGVILPFDPTDTTVIIDIAPICRSYMEAYYEDVLSSSGDILNMLVPARGLRATVNTFTVAWTDPVSGADKEKAYTVVYNYNTDYALTGADVANLNRPLLLEADPRQWIAISGYAVAGSTAYGWKKGNGSVNTYNSQGPLFQTLLVKLNASSVNARPDEVVSLLQDDGTRARFDYRIVKPCRNRFALYYVNKIGGLDSLLCSGRYVQSWNPSRTDIRMRNDRSSRTDFQQTRLFQQIAHRWELNTGWLDDDRADYIDELIFSPKCWIHDLDKDTVTSCLVTDGSYSAARYELSRTPAQYTIKVEESLLHERQ